MSNHERTFLNPEQAWQHYNLQRHPEWGGTNEVDRQLAEYGIASVEMPLTPDDFMAVSRGYDICLSECPDMLTQTALTTDQRYGSDVGHVRKEAKFDRRTGQQISDPKNYMHFNELAYPRWAESSRQWPQILRDFIADGYEIQHGLINLAKQQVRKLEDTHPNISQL